MSAPDTCASGERLLWSPPMGAGGVSSALQYCMPTFVGYVMNEGSRASSFQVQHASIAFAVVVVIFIALMEVAEVMVEENGKKLARGGQVVPIVPEKDQPDPEKGSNDLPWSWARQGRV